MFPQSFFSRINAVSLQLLAGTATCPYICTGNKNKNNMKTKSLLLAALLIVSSAVSFAGKDEPRKTGLAVVPVKNGDVFKVIYKAETVGKIKLNIYNANGVVVYSETLAGLDGFIYPVNFKGLNAGEYTVEVIDASGKKIEKVSYKSTEKKSANFHVSKLSEEGKFLVSVAASTSDAVSIKIYDNNNNLIHDEWKSIDGDFAQVYKITTASAGYTFELTDKSGNTKRLYF